MPAHIKFVFCNVSFDDMNMIIFLSVFSGFRASCSVADAGLTEAVRKRLVFQ